MNIFRLKTIDSTNSYLKDLAQKLIFEEGTVVVTNNQTNGRGQQGSYWESQMGKNITCSIVLYPSFLPIQQYFLISEAVSLGVKETLDAYIDGVTVKWSNDIYYLERKIAGILIENELIGDKFNFSVVGIGLNINQDCFFSDAPNPVSLKQITGKNYDIETIFKELIKNILHRYKQLKEGDTENLIRMYHEALYRKIGFHRYKDNERIFNARINRISDDGFLHLVTDWQEERSYSFRNVRFI